MKNLFFYTVLIVLVFSCKKHIKISDSESIPYTEPHRPQFHFSPPEKWMNDPNGMVYYEGEYHLFYQFYPDSTVWGPMHWGHAVSKDLIHWEHLPIALYPDSLGYIFSGSAVIDWKNTSGFGKEGKPAMVAIFTYHDPVAEKEGSNTFQYQGIAYSNDRGRTWTKYEGNPVVPNPGIRDFRDPKVIWDEDTKQWVMVFAAWDHVKLYGSSDLKKWQHLSDFGREWGTHAGVWECPDLFPMEVKETGEKKWVLLQSINPGGPNGGSATQYFVGDFDGKHFHLDPAFAKHVGKKAALDPGGKRFAGFDESDYGAWTVEGDAFGKAPAQGKIGQQGIVKGFKGKGLVNSFWGGDTSTGTLTSPPFSIESSYINFLVGGGEHPKGTYVALWVDGQMVRSTTGSNREDLDWAGWDVQEWQGKEAFVQIVDQVTGGWGHINLDEIRFADQAAQPVMEEAVWLDYGRDNYAGVTWSDIPQADGRRIFMGWMSNWDYAQVVPTEKWRSAMTLPRELELIQGPQGYRLQQRIIDEFSTISSVSQTMNELGPGQEVTVLNMEGGSQVRLRFSAQLVENQASRIHFKLLNAAGESYCIGFDGKNNAYFSDRTKAGKGDFSTAFAKGIHWAPRGSVSNAIALDLIIDQSSAELLADDGSVVITDIFFPSKPFQEIKVFTPEGAQDVTLSIEEVEAIW